MTSTDGQALERAAWARPFQLENPTNSIRYADGVRWPDGKVSLTVRVGDRPVRGAAVFHYPGMTPLQNERGLQHLVPVWARNEPQEARPPEVDVAWWVPVEWARVGHVRRNDVVVADFALMPGGAVVARSRGRLPVTETAECFKDYQERTADSSTRLIFHDEAPVDGALERGKPSWR